MKKEIFLIALIFALSSIGIYSQNLQNTSWKMYINPNTIVAYFHFSTDTLSAGQDGKSYLNVSTFKDNGTDFSIVDLTDDDCSKSDTGRYTYKIQNDTLKFTLQNEPCQSRAAGLTNFYFVRLKTDIPNSYNQFTIKVFPNPASDEIIIESQNDLIGSDYTIFDQLGRLLLTGKLIGLDTKVGIKQLSAGLYYLQIGGQNKQTFKLIKQ